MNRPNPYKDDGSFSTVELRHVVDQEIRTLERLLAARVRRGQMQADDRDHRLGALEMVRDLLTDAMVRIYPPELQGGPVFLAYFPRHIATARFEETITREFPEVSLRLA